MELRAGEGDEGWFGGGSNPLGPHGFRGHLCPRLITLALYSNFRNPVYHVFPVICPQQKHRGCEQDPPPLKKKKLPVGKGC